MPWYHAVAERDHDIQNPTSPGKIRTLGEWLRLGPESKVLDIACGRCGPALVLASTFGCRITGVEQATEFIAAARERITSADLDDLIDVVQSDAREWQLVEHEWDVVLCLGATFIWGDLDGTSMAAPHVSGAAVLLMARHRELIGRPKRVKEILCATATDLGRERYFQGHGMLDVLRAIQSV